MMVGRGAFGAFALAMLVVGAAPASARRASGASLPLVELLSPMAGERLAPGQSFRIAWRPLPELARHPEIEEWEAFLSLDGGATYVERLTPHLEADRRWFVARVPAVPTATARLLLRFGDERRELEMELPWTFEIARDGALLESVPPLPARGLGEPAREEGAGVALWIEGGRNGAHLRTLVAGRRSGSCRDSQLVTWTERPPFALSKTRSSPRPSIASSPPAIAERGDGIVPVSASATPPSALLDPRRRTCRQNE